MIDFDDSWSNILSPGLESVSRSTSSESEEVERVRMENALYKEMLEDTKLRDTEESTLRATLSGGWQLYTSSNVDDFLANRGSSETENLTFQLADIFFEFHENQVLIYYSVGRKRYQEKSEVLGEPRYFQGVSSVTYISGASGFLSLKSITNWDHNNGYLEKEERFLDKEDRLHIRTERFGVRCERIYWRTGEMHRALELRNNSEFSGTWKNIESSEILNLKVHGNFYFEKFDFDADFEKFQFDISKVANPERIVTVYREMDKIVKTEIDEDGEKNRWEKFLVDGKLYEHFFWNREFNSEEVYERIS